MIDTITITSAQNRYIKQIINLKSKKERDKTKLFVAEGERLVYEIPKSYNTKYLVLSKNYSTLINKENFKKNFPDKKVFLISDELFSKISDTVTPQGILAICEQKSFNNDDIIKIIKKENPFFILLEKISDPGNLGTLIRTADAAGVDAVFLSKGCVDLYNNKVIRATMGSIFHLPIISNLDFNILTDLLKNNDIAIYGAHLKGLKYHYEINLSKGCGILIGNEANGLTDEISKKATSLVKIPILGKAESINASIAGSILIYEAVRQRMLSKKHTNQLSLQQFR